MSTSWSHPPDRTLFAGVYQVPPGHLPRDRRRTRACPAVLGFRLPALPPSEKRMTPRPAARMGRAIHACVRGSGPIASARRRAGRVLLERRHRLVRGARRCLDAFRRGRSARTRCRSTTPTTTSAARRGAGAAAPAPSSARSTCAIDELGRPLRRRDLPRRAAVHQRARRRQVPAEPRRPRFGRSRSC